MWRELGWAAGRISVGLLPLAIVLAVLFASGALQGPVFALFGLALLAVAISPFVSLRMLRATARAVMADLGPGSGGGSGPSTWKGLSPAASAIRPAVARLDLAWRQRAAETAARLAAAEAGTAAMPVPLILIDARRRIVRANPAAAAFVGRLSEPRDLAASLRNPALLAAADAVLRGAPAQSVEFGVSVPVARQLEARFARIPSGGPMLDGAAAVLTLHDVTALKRAEQMRADFIANAGHELKTPLATLIGFIETLLGPAREDAEARERFLAIMREEAQRMARLVDDLRSLTRIEQSEHLPPSGSVALAPLLEHVAATLELRATERRMRIKLDVPTDLPETQGKRDELAQLFQNLIDNALKYGRPQTEIAV